VKVREAGFLILRGDLKTWREKVACFNLCFVRRAREDSLGILSLRANLYCHSRPFGDEYPLPLHLDRS
jgi:hypothetical protein